MELIIQDVVFTFSDFGVVLFALALIVIGPLSIYYYKKEYGKANKDELVVVRVLLLIGVIAIFCVLMYGIYDVLFYMVEKRVDNVETKVVTIEVVTGSNKGCEIIDSEGILYRFFRKDKEIWDTLEGRFLNNTCEIEYYKWSKYVRRLKVIE